MSDLSLLPGLFRSRTRVAPQAAEQPASPHAPVDWGREFQAHVRSIRPWLTRRVGSAVDAEDILQETFLLAHRNAHRFRGESLPSTWLYGIARNLSMRWLAMRAASPLESESAQMHEEVGLLAEPGRSLSCRQLLMALDRAMGALPRSQGEVLWLSAVDGLSSEEIALRLHITRTAVRSRLSRARAQLRKALGLD